MTLTMCVHGNELSPSNLLEGLALAPEAHDYVQSMAYNAHGPAAYLMLNDYTHAVEVYQKTIELRRAAANPLVEMMGISILHRLSRRTANCTPSATIASLTRGSGPSLKSARCSRPLIIPTNNSSSFVWGA